jgi:phage regulator Rha-like protein
MKNLPVPVERIQQSILYVREQKVLLDQELAKLYGVSTSQLVRQVKRNESRFPEDFCFRLNREEFESLKCQLGISNSRGGRRTLPYAFTEQGVAMLSSVLHSERAIEVNIAIMRAFVKLREVLATHKDLARKLAEIERQLGKHDEQFRIVFDAIRQLMAAPEPPPKRKIGYRADVSS